jgi:hypothetical protein
MAKFAITSRRAAKFDGVEEEASRKIFDKTFLKLSPKVNVFNDDQARDLAPRRVHISCRRQRFGIWFVALSMLLSGIFPATASEKGENEPTTTQLIELAKGSVKPLKGLEDKHLFNAENLTISTDGRVFVTGSKGVYEILRPDGDHYTQTEIPIKVDKVSSSCSRHGIVSYDENLYLICVHIHEGENPNLEELCDVADVELTLWKAIFLYRKVFKKCQIDSYLLYADLNSPQLEFSDGVALQPTLQVGESIQLNTVRQQEETLSAKQNVKLVANGMAVDKNGVLFIANSNHDPSKDGSVGIIKVEVTGRDPMTATQTAWLRPDKGAPNGMQIVDDTLSYTANASLTGRLMKIEINNKDGVAETVYKKFWSAFDDLVVADDIIVITDFFGDKLRFVSQRGVLLGKLKGVEKPSAVAYTENKSPLFEAGVLLITEKGKHRLSILE